MQVTLVAIPTPRIRINNNYNNMGLTGRIMTKLINIINKRDSISSSSNNNNSNMIPTLDISNKSNRGKKQVHGILAHIMVAGAAEN